MKTYKQFKREVLKDRKIRAFYEEFGPEFEVIALLIKKRLQRKITQKELARKIGTKQSAISRLESGDYNPSLSFLYKVADALGARLRVSIGSK